MGGYKVVIKIFPTTLNTGRGDNPIGVHPVCWYAAETLVHFCPEQFSISTLVDSDCVLTNAPSAPPYSFDQSFADEIIAAKKPVFIINDADGAPPDCEGETPDKEHNFQNFVRGGNGVRAYFYREWFAEYERPDLPFPLLPYELVGYLWTNHPKDQADWFGKDTFEQFKARPVDILFAQALNCQSRIALHKALKGKPRCVVVDLNKDGRYPIKDHLARQAQAKITIALEGSGVKCCSTHEASVNSVMATGDIAMNWTHKWLHGANCIRLSEHRNKGEGSLVHNFGRGLTDVAKSIESLNWFLDHPALLYALFQSGVGTARKYSLPNYYREHLGANIVKYL